MKRKREDLEVSEKEVRKQKKLDRGDNVSSLESQDVNSKKKKKKRKRNKEKSHEIDEGSSSAKKVIDTPKKKMNLENSGGTSQKKKKQKVKSETSQEDEVLSSPKKSGDAHKKKQKISSETSQEEDEVLSSPKKSGDAHKKKQKMGSETSQEEDEVLSSPNWTMADFEALLDSVETAGELDTRNNKIPAAMWNNVHVGDHSQESCVKAWSRICQVAKSRLTIQDLLEINRRLISKPNAQVTKLLTGKDREFPDAPHMALLSGYNVYTKIRLKNIPRPSFKVIADEWRTFEESERQKYIKESVKIMEQQKKDLSQYLDSLSPERRERYLELQKRAKEKNKSKKSSRPLKAGSSLKVVRPKMVHPPKLNSRDLKRAESQFMKEEKQRAVRENPGLEEKEILNNLSEKFHSLSYEQQLEYQQRAAIEATDQKKIKDFFKQFEIPRKVKGKKSDSGQSSKSKKSTSHKKTLKTTSSCSEESSDAEDQTKREMSPVVPVVTTPKKTIPRARSSSSSSSSSSSDEEERTVPKSSGKVTTPKKTAPRARSSSSSSSSSSDEEAPTVPKSSGKSPFPVKSPAPVTSASLWAKSSGTPTSLKKKKLGKSSPSKAGWGKE